ncbi:MAG: hypothetical protein RMJ98_07055 [Myxococcales bacterium]|nr:hypothetical protein [Polyangiaceae bacterium]MDW8249045.1 hypothetical protein [Myxococcales bacterium]
MAPPTLPLLLPLARAARRTEIRLRTNEALRWFSVGLIPTLTALGGWLTHAKLTHSTTSLASMTLLGAAAAGAIATAGAVLWAYLRRYPEQAGSIRLDVSHQLHDRITSALSFAKLPSEQRTPLMEAAIEDAAETCKNLSPKKAAPIHFPPELGVAATMGLLILGLSSLQWSRKVIVHTPTAQTIDAITLSPDDLDLYRETLHELAEKDQSPETQAALERFNQLIEDIAQKRLDRAEAFRRMEALERELLQSQKADAKALDEAFKNTAEELKKNPHTKNIGEALAKKDLHKARQELKNLAQKFREQKSGKDKKKLSEEDKKRLKEALEKAAKANKEVLQRLQERREELRASLLRREQKPTHEQNDEERRLLQREKKELERLDREIEQKERAQRQLDRLDRELSQAAEDLLKDLGLSAEDLERGAEDINRMAQEEMSEKEKEELRQRLQELRELLRQEGKGGEEMKKRLRKFAKKARGQQGDDGNDQGKKGKQGKQKQGQGNDEDEDEDSENSQKGPKGQKKGQQGQGEEDEDDEDGEEGQGQQGKGKKGKGKKGNGDGEWVIGPGGKKIWMQKGGGQGQGQGEGQGQGALGGQGQGQGGKQWGTGHEGNIAGKETSGKFGTQDVQAAAGDTGQGPSVSETILGAAQRGFVGKSYKKVYADYKTHAEEAMKKEDIPPGYRFYIQRYFQLIRPRD